MLPNDCVFNILTFTSAADTCRSSLVSSSFRHVAYYDTLWDTFLPDNYLCIVSRSTIPLEVSSKRDLYFSLTNSILIDGGNKSFKLDKSTGKISYILSARELSITLGDNSAHWTWKSLSESRFSQVAILKTIQHLEIEAKIKTNTLSKNTKYGVYLIIKILDSSFGLDSIPSVVSLEVGNLISRNTAYIRTSSNNNIKQIIENLFYKNWMERLRSTVEISGDGRVPCEGRDGWMEIELGEFFSDDIGNYASEVKVGLREVNGYHLKSGLIIEGIEVRPK